MKILNTSVAISALLFSTLSSAALVVTSNGFMDTSDHLEWLAPGRVTSLSSYNAYTANGWRVANTQDLMSITASYGPYNLHYSAFDQSVFNAFKTISNVGNCSFANAFFCSTGWYQNTGTDGSSFGYEVSYIGLLSSPSTTDPNTVQQYKFNMTSAVVSTTIGSYPLYGFENNYSTFMVRAVPLPATAWLLGSGLLGFAGVARRKSKGA